ncbi:aminotransferase class I/II-fold pyridoxal phosphate-dependent enzyme [Limibacter armeniacum]|uniref:pyridoxal phosphate-dependent decarboxylase family protein n=1 Tax=Limibacter armeniacum TaxID=466084 RepID=UPI002FE560D6
MMDIQAFRKNAHQMVDWMADYFEQIEQYPVKSQVKPNDIYQLLPETAPEQAEDFQAIFSDFQKTILQGITHWQSPNFFAYFPANSSYPSVLAEMLTATMGAQCMIWETSPAAAELEERMMEWLKEMMGLPNEFVGVIQDTASTATLCAILSAREKASGFTINHTGFTGKEQFRVYCSSQTHSSIDKAVRIAGLGSDHLRKIEVDEHFAMKADKLQAAIIEDIANGFTPLCVVAATGTTSSTAMDPIKMIGEVCQQHNVWLHVDAAYAGTAAILPEKRWILDGLELADSYVFNPHKWMFTNFDCTAYYVKDKGALIRTFEILPEYLKTKNDHTVNNYRDWGVQLGRRFRALKLWFVIRSFGVEGIRNRLRDHLSYATYFEQEIKQRFEVEIMTPTHLNLVCFRFKPTGLSEDALEKYNQGILDNINKSGKAYLTHTKLDGKYTIRAVFGQTYLQKKHVSALISLLEEVNTEHTLKR